MRILRNYISVLVLLLVVSACSHKDLCIEHPHLVPVRIEANWDKFSELPVNMTVIFYPKDGTEVIVVRNSNHHTTRVKVPVNTYDVVVFNEHVSDFGTIGFKDMKDYATAEAYVTNLVKTRIMQLSADTKVMADPERLGVALIKDYEVTERMLETYRYQLEYAFPIEDNVMAVSPEDKVYMAELKFKAKGLQYVRAVEGTLSGLAGGYLFSKDSPSTDRVTHMLTNWQKVYTTRSEEGEGYLSAICWTFGLPSDHTGEPEQNVLKMSVPLVDLVTVMDFEFMVGDRISIDNSGEHIVFNIELDLDIVFPEVHPEEDVNNGLVIDPSFDGDHWVEWNP